VNADCIIRSGLWRCKHLLATAHRNNCDLVFVVAHVEEKSDVSISGSALRSRGGWVFVFERVITHIRSKRRPSKVSHVRAVAVGVEAVESTYKHAFAFRTPPGTPYVLEKKR
jgi:hypothetical protein